MEKDSNYWTLVEEKAKELGSDGCSGVSEWNQICCYEHDMHYRLGKGLDGKPITRREADAAFYACNRRSRVSVVRSYIRWLGVRLFGGHAWKHK